MTREARWMSELDFDKRQWLLDNEGGLLPEGFAAAIIAAGGPVARSGWVDERWSCRPQAPSRGDLVVSA